MILSFFLFFAKCIESLNRVTLTTSAASQKSANHCRTKFFNFSFLFLLFQHFLCLLLQNEALAHDDDGAAAAVTVARLRHFRLQLQNYPMTLLLLPLLLMSVALLLLLILVALLLLLLMSVALLLLLMLVALLLLLLLMLVTLLLLLMFVALLLLLLVLLMLVVWLLLLLLSS